MLILWILGLIAIGISIAISSFIFGLMEGWSLRKAKNLATLQDVAAMKGRLEEELGKNPPICPEHKVPLLRWHLGFLTWVCPNCGKSWMIEQ